MYSNIKWQSSIMQNCNYFCTKLIYIQLNQSAVHLRLTQQCKLTILQLKKILKNKSICSKKENERE